MQAVLEVVEMETHQHSPNYALVMLWAALANATPVSAWETMRLFHLFSFLFCFVCCCCFALFSFSLGLQFFTHFGGTKR